MGDTGGETKLAGVRSRSLLCEGTGIPRIEEGHRCIGGISWRSRSQRLRWPWRWHRARQQRRRPGRSLPAACHRGPRPRISRGRGARGRGRVPRVPFVARQRRRGGAGARRVGPRQHQLPALPHAGAVPPAPRAGHRRRERRGIVAPAGPAHRRLRAGQPALRVGTGHRRPGRGRLRHATRRVHDRRQTLRAPASALTIPRRFPAR